jgi:hypothetical protein
MPITPTLKNKVYAFGIDGQSKCDICQQPLLRFARFYDASTMRGWGWLCVPCFHDHGMGLGTGVGQEYDSKTMEKTAG